MERVGTGLSPHSSVSWVWFVRCKKFEGNFTMALCSFGGVIDQCGTTSWTANEIGMVSLLSCEMDMTEWLKKTYKGLRAYGEEEDLVLPTDSKYQLGIIYTYHVCAQIAFIAIQWTLY